MRVHGTRQTRSLDASILPGSLIADMLRTQQSSDSHLRSAGASPAVAQTACTMPAATNSLCRPAHGGPQHCTSQCPVVVLQASSRHGRFAGSLWRLAVSCMSCCAYRGSVGRADQRYRPVTGLSRAKTTENRYLRLAACSNALGLNRLRFVRAFHMSNTSQPCGGDPPNSWHPPSVGRRRSPWSSTPPA